MNFVRHLVAACAALIVAAPLAIAHPGHGEEITREDAMKRAGIEVDRLVEETKLEKSWLLDRVTGGAERRVADEEVEWVVTFDNPKATDTVKRRLYVFLTASGDYLAANFSGK